MVVGLIALWPRVFHNHSNYRQFHMNKRKVEIIN
jgi:hypothetical protein